MRKKEKQLGSLERTFEINPLYLARVTFVAARSFLFFLGMLLGFYMRAQIGYFILSSAFLIVYLLTMFGWFVLKRQKLEIREKGISYRRIKLFWDEVSAVDQINGKSFYIRSSDGSRLEISDSVADWEKVREIVTQRTGF